MTFQEVLNLAKQLSPEEKVRLIEQITPDEKRELVDKPTPRKSLWGLCANLGRAPSSDDIDLLRKEEWANFPREDM